MKKSSIDVAYFSMEMMLESDIPIYAGGLGVLAGDLLRSCADLKVPAVGMSLVYSGTVFAQMIEPDGSQQFKEVDWRKLDQLTRLPEKIVMKINGRDVSIACWRYDIVGFDGFVVPIYFLDTDFYENDDWSRLITRNLYAQQGDLRIAQEVVLGIGGVKMLRKLGYNNIKTYHMNEGHCSFVALELLAENEYKDDKVRKLCSFTTHTPIPEGHDVFDYDLAYQIAGDYLPWHIKDLASADRLHMTKLGMSLSKTKLAVSKKHEKVSNHILPGYDIKSVTNGIHHRTWISPYLQDLYEKYIPGSLKDPSKLKNSETLIPDDELWRAHLESKRELLHYVNKHLTSIDTRQERENPNPADCFDENILTIAMARRPVEYKRPLLFYHDLERLMRIGKGKIQIIQCGKSHFADEISQKIVHEIIRISKKCRTAIKVVYLENYSPRIARFLVAGTDIWLNTPIQPLEASGTSGMKAAMNGVLNFSVPDGWWIEGYKMRPDAGFVIGEEIKGLDAEFNNDKDADSIYEVLEHVIIPTYYNNRKEWTHRMKQAIALGSYFNTHRCIREYQTIAWNT
ncbi:hypothetical protein A3G65_01565 [Candidatus Roizmanbacteria bacterium RIFCSPLOWO2_12_FULL_37_7b]|nr:MAG: hypothetical protein A3G65_01565 [Candidatus Roizmanbacteria bacterium RIFCSPLOWO2_12_FULL_37_7b]